LYMKSLHQPDGGIVHTFKVQTVSPECESYAVELAHSIGIRYADSDFIRTLGEKLSEKV